MSATTSAVSDEAEIECDHDLHPCLCDLDADASLFQDEQLRDRLIALDALDAQFGGFASEELSRSADLRTYKRAKALRARLEAVNTELYRSVRSAIAFGGQPGALFKWLQDSTSQSESKGPSPGLGFDFRDDLVSGVLQLREPSEPNPPRLAEMVPYQPTPVRHILQLIASTALAEDDVFVDLGSGLGHVPLLVSMATGAQSVGIEVQPAYVASAQRCAQSLHLSRVRFRVQDVRESDLSSGTVFYLYSPFNGSILTDVLRALRIESMRKSIKICSLGPSTRTVAGETWLKASVPPDTECITVFDSQ